ncbi:mediator complex subunit [Neophaeococcomyces mojaviensis]|uniref:Mediator complex subunit n=1 Tax=Neophaeococcomyces mojaviensis TaxID=3383035 RepID=A0ACC3A5T9_9EURO|nr:mediator complex subunit [Knufia sp. JES_112]
MNGHHSNNGLVHTTSPRPQANGNIAASAKNAANQLTPGQQFGKENTASNGISEAQNSVALVRQSGLDMEKLPPEVVEILTHILPDDVYVPMSRLINRTAQSCWQDLLNLIDDLAERPIPDPTEVMARLPAPENQIINDMSDLNRLKKKKMWDFAETHKRTLIKMLVLLQWSSKSQENRLTIALNRYLLELRVAYNATNTALANLADVITSRHDASPDLETAMQVLAAERVPGLPDLGYVGERKLTEKQILSIIRRLNTVLSIRMTFEDSIPEQLSDWHIHDGRVTFNVQNEFGIDLSVASEDTDADFLMVDFQFNFVPTPPLPDDLHDQIAGIVNTQLAQNGLQGAYSFLHELVLTQKLKEYHRQAISLTQGLWNGHLRVEMLKRTLVVQYWTRRLSSKSWIEITINSGRSAQDVEGSSPLTPFLGLRWMRHGKLVSDHEISMNMARLSFESILNQVIAHHTNSIFDGIYNRLVTQTLFTNNELDLEQSSSLFDTYDCSLSMELSKTEYVNLTLDPIGGTVVLSPANERTGRLQYELSRSKNIVDDFINRFSALRCGLAQSRLLNAIKTSSWQYLVGRKPAFNEVKDFFGPSFLRAVFFRQPGWSDDWMLAAAFGVDSDTWFLVFEPSINTLDRIVQILPGVKPLHLEPSLSLDYFDKLAKHSAETIMNQTTDRELRKRGLRTVMSGSYTPGVPSVQFEIPDDEGLDTISKTANATPWSSKRALSKFVITIRAKLDADEALLNRLSSAIADKSIEILPKKRLLILRLEAIVGGSIVNVLFTKLHYINNILSCIKIVHHSEVFKIQSLSVKDIVIAYHERKTTTLSIALLLDTVKSESNNIQLLPAATNPHKLVLTSITKILDSEDKPLFSRFENVLTFLRMTFPLLNTIHYLQGLVPVEEVSAEMAAVDLSEARKWLRIHVLTRDDSTLGVDVFAINSSFQRDDESVETPRTLLARLEIKQVPKLQSWLIRPSVVEFQSYTRPSFTSRALEERLKQKVFTANNNKGWVSLDSAATCKYEEPQYLLKALYITILDWMREAVNKKDETLRTPNPTTKPNSQGGIPQQQPGRNMQQSGGPSRVMTAAPQQVRQPPPQQQRRQGNQNQNQNQNRNTQQRSSVPHDVITLE